MEAIFSGSPTVQNTDRNHSYMVTNIEVLGHLVGAHQGRLKRTRGFLPGELPWECDGVRYQHAASFDDADAFTDALLADGWSVPCDNDFVRGIYTLFFSVSEKPV